jgi:hypothetical protein
MNGPFFTELAGGGGVWLEIRACNVEEKRARNAKDALTWLVAFCHGESGQTCGNRAR